MQWDCVEHIIRYTRLREELKPVEIYPVDTLEPIRPDWVAITHGVSRSTRWPKGIEGFNLCFLLDDGQLLALECFETLEIALDQAKAISGIRHDEWETCEVEVRSDDGSFRWADVP